MEIRFRRGNIRKTIAWILTLCMVIGMMQISSFAGDDIEETEIEACYTLHPNINENDSSFKIGIDEVEDYIELSDVEGITWYGKAAEIATPGDATPGNATAGNATAGNADGNLYEEITEWADEEYVTLYAANGIKEYAYIMVVYSSYAIVTVDFYVTFCDGTETYVDGTEPGTCYRKGQNHEYCTLCDEFVRDVETDYGEHDFSRKCKSSATIISEGDCQTHKTYHYRCSMCTQIDTSDRFFESDEYGDHDYSVMDPSDEALASAADCVNKATYYYTCSICGDIDTDGDTFEYGDYDDSKHDSDIVKNAKEATCKDEGYTGDRYCSKCDTLMTAGNAIPADPDKHNYTDNPTEETLCKAATHTTKAVYYKSCSVCGDVSEDTFTYGDVIPLDKTTVTLKIKSTGIRLDWTAVEDAEGYRIYRGGKLIATVTGNTYTDTGVTNGSKYTYTVEAYVDDNAVKSNAAASYFVKSPDVKSVKNSKKSIKVTWTANSKASGYYIYRSKNGGAYSLVKKITSASTTSWTDTKAYTNGASYQYKISAFKTVSGTTYKGVAGKSGKIIYLKAPTISSAKNNKKKTVTVKWSKNKKASGYQIKYTVGSKTIKKKVTGKSTVKKVLKSLKKGKTYKIYIRSYVKSGSVTYYSAWSSVKKVKIKK